MVAVGDAHGRLSSQLHAMALAVAMTPTPSEMQRIDLTGKGFRVKEISMTLTDKSIGGRVCWIGCTTTETAELMTDA